MSRTERANQYADMIIKDKLSIREVAKVFGVSKTTVHNYLHKYVTGSYRKFRLQKQLDANLDNWFLKGGCVTKEKYRILRQKG